MIFVKRAYEAAKKSDGRRFLVDRLWPRGLKKTTLKVEAWTKAVSPSGELCRWYGHEVAKWEEFRRRYFEELSEKPDVWRPLLTAAQNGDITLVFAARDTEHSNAAALRAYLTARTKTKPRANPDFID